MSNKVKFIASALLISSAFTLGSATKANAASHQEMEKCWGVVQPGMNDCRSKVEGHSCQGGGKDPKHNWLYMPKGLCERLVNGRLTEALDDEDDE